MAKYQVWSYDVWANDEDCYHVNDRFKGNVIGLNDNPDIAEQELQKLVTNNTELEWNENGYYFNDKTNGKPIGEIELIVE